MSSVVSVFSPSSEREREREGSSTRRRRGVVSLAASAVSDSAASSEVDSSTTQATTQGQTAPAQAPVQVSLAVPMPVPMSAPTKQRPTINITAAAATATATAALDNAHDDIDDDDDNIVSDVDDDDEEQQQYEEEDVMQLDQLDQLELDEDQLELDNDRSRNEDATTIHDPSLPRLPQIPHHHHPQMMEAVQKLHNLEDAAAAAAEDQDGEEDENDDGEDVDDEEELSSDDDDDENAVDLGDVGPEDEPLPTDDAITILLKQTIKEAKIEAKTLHQYIKDTAHKIYALKETELEMEEVLLKADFHPDLLSQLHQIETKHDTLSLLALSKLDYTRACATDTCLAFAKMANDTFLDRRKQARSQLCNPLIEGVNGIQHEYLVATEKSAAQVNLGPLARRGKRKEMHEAFVRGGGGSSNANVPDWIREAVLRRKVGRRSVAGSGPPAPPQQPQYSRRRDGGRHHPSVGRSTTIAAAFVPPGCDGLAKADIEDDVALIRVLTSTAG
ncbi:UNVERIFIED_CONTAM: hypothetical protein HDU68_004611 [Siphonaria sp. JEL0065]|nr:hypothetical protein HDU68_004611 [Siphonaria sp. JEL0065]